MYRSKTGSQIKRAPQKSISQFFVARSIPKSTTEEAVSKAESKWRVRGPLKRSLDLEDDDDYNDRPSKYNSYERDDRGKGKQFQNRREFSNMGQGYYDAQQMNDAVVDAEPADASKERKETDEIILSSAQAKVLDSVMRGRSVFFTGAAGTGKSYLLGIIKDIFASAGKSNRIAFTAPCGVAACNIGGLTIHSWAGIGLGSDSIEAMAGRVEGSAAAKARWTNTDVLVIDEVSMLSAKLLDALSVVGKRIRNNYSQPFGGLQDRKSVV